MSKRKKVTRAIPVPPPPAPPDGTPDRPGPGQDVEFLGWQHAMSGDIFPLYNIVKPGHPKYRFTVAEPSLKDLHLRTPLTPSPYPEVQPSPWHSLGIPLLSPATAREAIEAAGLNYTVVKKPLQDVVGPEYPGGVLHRWATVRTDTGDILGVVSEAYHVVQNIDAFGVFDKLVAANETIYETAGALGRGERIWILAKLPGYIKVRGNDLVSKYLLLSNSHDGSSLLQMKLTPIRVVCNNTLNAALKGSGEVNIRHTANAAEDAAQALFLLGLSNSLYDQLAVIFNRMAKTKISDGQLSEYLHALVPNIEGSDNGEGRAIRKACSALYESGHGAELARGTLWGAFNCVTEYTDHRMEDDPSVRLESIWSGGGEQLTQRAFHLAERMM
jgi:phage/plasmid-like protein (TIGR03299 family)